MSEGERSTCAFICMLNICSSPGYSTRACACVRTRSRACVCPCMCMSLCVCVCAYKHRYYGMYIEIEDNFQELVISFHHVGPRDGSQVLGFGRKLLHPLSHLDCLLPTLFFEGRISQGTWSIPIQLNYQTSQQAPRTHLFLPPQGWVMGTYHHVSLSSWVWRINLKSSPMCSQHLSN